VLHLFTDGAARGNPGPAAYAWLLTDPVTGEVLDSDAQRIGKATNNVAEYTAIIRGLGACLPHTTSVRVHSDSELCIKQLNGEYKVRKDHLKPLHKQVKDLASEFEEVAFVHVTRDDQLIRRCDEMANGVLDK